MSKRNVRKEVEELWCCGCGTGSVGSSKVSEVTVVTSISSSCNLRPSGNVQVDSNSFESSSPEMDSVGYFSSKF